MVSYVLIQFLKFYKLLNSEKEQQEKDEETIKIVFNFAKNPYLSNDSLEKIIKTKDDVGIKSSHTPIQWKVLLSLKFCTTSSFNKLGKKRKQLTIKLEINS